MSYIEFKILDYFFSGKGKFLSKEHELRYLGTCLCAASFVLPSPCISSELLDSVQVTADFRLSCLFFMVGYIFAFWNIQTIVWQLS